MVNVGKYTSPMDPMGYSSKARFYVRSACHSMTNGMGNGNLGVDESFAKTYTSGIILLWPPPRMPVTTRIMTCLIGNPYKPSFATVTGRGPHPRYNATASFSGVSNRTVNYFGKQKSQKSMCRFVLCRLFGILQYDPLVHYKP